MDPFVGEIRLFAFQRIPRDWLACDGSSLSIANYEALYNLIGTTFGGDGVTTFNLPDLRGRVPISQGQGKTLSNRTLGQIGGETTHTLSTTEMPSHSHGLVATTTAATTPKPDPSVHLAGGNPTTVQVYAQAPGMQFIALAPSLGVAGQSVGHDNMMPTLTGNYCIATQGVYPSQN